MYHIYGLLISVQKTIKFDNCYRLPHYRDSRTGLEMCCSVNEGGYFHYIREKDDHFSPVIVL